MKLLTGLFIALLASMSLAETAAPAAPAEPVWEEGKHYIALPQAVPTVNPDKVEVAEVFRYTCPHCMTFEPLIKAWEKTLPEDVYLEKVPVAVGSNNIVHAKAFYVARAMGVLDKVNDPLFVALAQKRERINDQKAMAKFFAEHGVDPLVFNKVYNSFGIDSLVTQAGSKLRGYQIGGTPELIVNGKYRVSGNLLKSREEMFQVVNYLVTRERIAKAEKAQ